MPWDGAGSVVGDSSELPDPFGPDRHGGRRASFGRPTPAGRRMAVRRRGWLTRRSAGLEGVLRRGPAPARLPAVRRRPVADELVELCLRAATHAPSAENLQPWVFVVVRDAVAPGRHRSADPSSVAPGRPAALGRSPGGLPPARGRPGGRRRDRIRPGHRRGLRRYRPSVSSPRCPRRCSPPPRTSCSRPRPSASDRR